MQTSTPRPAAAHSAQMAIAELVAALGATRAGCVRTLDAVALGLDRATLRQRCATGDWRLLHGGRVVFVASGAAPDAVPRDGAHDFWVRVHAALCAAGAGAAVCGTTAEAVRASAHGPQRMPATIELAVPVAHRGRLSGVRQVVVADWRAGETTEVAGVPVANMLRPLRRTARPLRESGVAKQ